MNNFLIRLDSLLINMLSKLLIKALARRSVRTGQHPRDWYEGVVFTSAGTLDYKARVNQCTCMDASSAVS